MKLPGIILGMAAVTYLPRLLPGLWMNDKPLPGRFQKWLENIPYAALGALIFPGILNAHRENPLVGLLSGAVAAVLSLLRLHIGFVMAGAILTALIAQGL